MPSDLGKSAATAPVFIPWPTNVEHAAAAAATTNRTSRFVEFARMIFVLIGNKNKIMHFHRERMNLQYLGDKLSIGTHQVKFSPQHHDHHHQQMILN